MRALMIVVLLGLLVFTACTNDYENYEKMKIWCEQHNMSPGGMSGAYCYTKDNCKLNEAGVEVCGIPEIYQIPVK